MVNRENMEKWINALEAYDKEPTRGMLASTGIDGVTRMCALGIGMNARMPDLLPLDSAWSLPAFLRWLELPAAIDVHLKPDGSGCDRVLLANDKADQSPWTIAQRLRETYLKEES